MLRLFAIFSLVFLYIGCSGSAPATIEDFAARPLTLPDGTTVRAEVMTQPMDIQRGMMFRTSFPEGRAMLFVHGSASRYTYWMYQVKVPLDIVWMTKDHKVVEISANTPPCTTQASKCPSYGGTQDSMLVLELPAGSAARHGIKVGEVIRF